MLGAIVNHPAFGRGQVVETRNAGREAAVRFDNGIRTVVQSNMLSVLQPSVVSIKPPRPVIVPRPERVFTPEEVTRRAARHTIEALRYGVVPAQRIRELSVGLAAERASLSQAFAQVREYGGDARVIVGEYGTGKSHFF